MLKLETMERKVLSCSESVLLNTVEIDSQNLGPIQAYVVDQLPLNVDLVVGLDVIVRMGLHILKDKTGKIKANFGAACATVDPSAQQGDQEVRLLIDDEDFSAWFGEGHWTAKWVWDRKGEGEKQPNKRFYENVPSDCRESFDAEIESWIKQGILVPHDPKSHGEVKQFLPMIAVQQDKGGVQKTRPVFDYREMNREVVSCPAGATPICADKIRRWRQVGTKCALVDLRKAYLQVHIDRSLWAYQAIRWRGTVFLLTRLGFGLSIAPKILTAVVNRVLQQDEEVQNGVEAYIDDLFVNEDLISAGEVRAHLEKWGLQAKEPEILGRSVVRVLGIRVNEQFEWRRDQERAELGEEILTKRKFLGVLGRWLGHFPVAGWLRMACAFLQRCASSDTDSWDQPVSGETMEKLRQVEKRMRDEGDPVRGKWPVHRESPITIWADASSLAIGVRLEIGGDIVEDAAWLRAESDSAHINRAELDAVIRGINLALRWGPRKIRVMSDSKTVCGWLNALIHKSHNVRTRSLGEILIRRRLDTLKEIIEVERLDVSVEYVRSAENLADSLTRVPKAWLKESIRPTGASAAGITGLEGPTDSDEIKASLKDIKKIHEQCHFGVERTLELARQRFGLGVSRKSVRKVVSRCQECARIDPAVNIRWDHGRITASEVSERWAADITHFKGKSYLSTIDIASGFTVWHALRNESAMEVVDKMRQMFAVLGPPQQLLMDNGTVFRSREMSNLLNQWDVQAKFSCAYRPQGNAVIERVHRTVKRTSARTGRSVEEACFWVNTTRGTKTVSPYEMMFGAQARMPGVTEKRKMIERPKDLVMSHVSNAEDYDNVDRNPFSVGELVFLKNPNGRCDESWSGPHRITEIKSAVAAEIEDDGIHRHVSHLRRVPRKVSENRGERDRTDSSESDSESSSEMEEVQQTVPQARKSSRERRRPGWWSDYDM